MQTVSTSVFALIVIPGDGCSSIAEVVLTVNPYVDGGEVEVERVCDGNMLYVIDPDNPPNPLEGDDKVYTWYLNGVQVAVIEGLPYFSPSEPGDYTVEVIDSNPDECRILNSLDNPYAVEEIINCKNCPKD